MLQEQFPVATSWAEHPNPKAKPKKAKKKSTITTTAKALAAPPRRFARAIHQLAARAWRWFIGYCSEVTRGALVLLGITVLFAVGAALIGFNYDPDLFKFPFRRAQASEASDDASKWMPIVIPEPDHH